MNILIHPNFEKEGSIDCTKRTICQLVEFSITPMIAAEHRETVGDVAGCEYGEYDEMLTRCDILLTIGGDGTILNALPNALRADKPILGINAGRLGFLTQLEADELESLQLLAQEHYLVKRRMLLEVTIGDDRHAYTALNDVVLSRADSERVVEIDVRCETGPIASHRADGLIFSTPTGSTAYQLSAGGPIAAPGLDIILMTAICPQTLGRPMILSPKRSYVARELPGNNQNGLRVSVDGQRAGTLKLGESVQVRRSGTLASFIDLGLRDFYARVDQKLSFRR